MVRVRQEKPSDSSVLSDGFSRGSRSLTFAQIIERNPARFKTDLTVRGYQDRLLYEIANFRNLATTFARLKSYARKARNEAKRGRLLDLAARYERELYSRRLQEWRNRIRANALARVLGLRPEFDPEEPEPEEEGMWRISKLREWSANEVVRRTPTPYAEIRVYVYTKKPQDPKYSERSLDNAMDAIEVWLTTGLASYPLTRGSEREEVDDDELEQENAHQGRGSDVIREDDVWYYVAFWKMPDLNRPEFEYYGRCFMREGSWRASQPKQFKGRPPSFGTPFTAVWIPPRRRR